MIKPRTLAAVLVTASAAAPPAQDPPAAVVVKVEGTVAVQPGDRTGTYGTRLSAGDEIVPAEGAQAVIVHATGWTQVVTEAITVDAPGGGREGDAFSRTVRVLAQATTSDARRTGNRQGMIRPLPGGPAPIAPRNDVRVLTPTPTFFWFAVDGAAGYMIQVRTEGSRPVRFDAGPDTTFTLPKDAALTRGATYRWTVAPAGGRPVKEEGFTVLAPGHLETLEESLRSIRAMGIDPEDEGRLVVAALYADLGLAYDAADVLATLEESGTLAADVFSLKGEVLDAMGHYDAARAAFDRADEMSR